MNLRHLPNEEDSCPSQCLTKGTISLTSSLEVPEGTLHPADATVDASGAHNGVANYWGVPQQCEEHDRLHDAVVEEFSRRYPRRPLLINPFSE